MNENNIRAVLFDVGGVLVTRRLEPRKFMSILGLNPQDDFDVECVDKAIWSHRDHHDLGMDDREFWATVALDLGVDVPRGEQLLELIEADTSRMDQAEPEALVVVDSLIANGLKVGILANAPASVAHRIRHSEWACNRFTHCVFSAEYHVRKPHSSIYQAAAQALQLESSEILFVDDRAKHVRGAQYVGMDAIRWTTSEDVVTQLRQRNLF